MKTVIYYFSATGNSLTVARDIARRLSDTELVSIPDAGNAGISTDASRIGLVFPVHMFGVPKMVVRFINTLQVSAPTYIFAVATCGGMACATLKQTERLFADRGLKLAAGYALSMVNNCTTVAEAPQRHKQIARLEKARLRIERICAAVEKGRRYVYPGLPVINRIFSRILYEKAIPRIPEMSSRYFTDRNCNGCGICAQVCPVNNISMKVNRPVWERRCEACYACLQWCPQESVQFGNRTIGRRRYHHPAIQLADILPLRKKAA